MATSISSTSPLACASLVPTPRMPGSSSTVLGLPATRKMAHVSCTMDTKSPPSSSSISSTGTPGFFQAATTSATTAAAAVFSPAAAVAVVDERMSTEGTGLPFGLSNNLLGWILLGVFGLIWSLYFAYTSTLDEDEDSGLSL